MKGIFELHPKSVLSVVIIASLTLTLFSFELLLSISSSPGLYYDEGLKRHIRLREHVPLSSRTIGIGRPMSDDRHIRWNESYVVKIDKDGFIFPSSVHSSPDLKIFFLGGSTTECLLMNDDQRFPYLVGRYLERSDLKVNSYNGGVSGNNSMHSINILLNKVLPMEPDFVVFMHNINDLVPLMYYGTYWNESATRSLIVEGKELTFSQHLIEASKSLARRLIPNIYERLRELRSELTKRNGTDEWHDIRSPNLYVNEDHIGRQYKRSLMTFIQIAKVHSFTPILMTQVRRTELTSVSDSRKSRWLLRTRLFGKFNDIIREIGETANVHVIDLDLLVPKDKEYMYDSLHYTAKGADFVARVIARYFNDNLLPDRRSDRFSHHFSELTN